MKSAGYRPERSDPFFPQRVRDCVHVWHPAVGDRDVLFHVRQQRQRRFAACPGRKSSSPTWTRAALGFRPAPKNIPGGKKARTLGELVVNVLQSDELADLVQVSLTASAEAARAAVDQQTAQVAIIIPADFSKTFADPDKRSTVEFYQDPTLTIGPDIIRSILNRFMDGMAGVKIALTVFLDEAAPAEASLAGQVVQHYLDTSLVQTKDLEAALLDTRHSTAAAPQRDDNLLLRIIGPIMAGMLIFFAFFTGTSTAESILKEEEERTLPRCSPRQLHGQSF